MRILEFHIRALSLELKTPLRTSRAEYRVRRGAVIELSDGRQRGWGEAMPLTSFGTEDLEQCLRVLGTVASAIAEQDLPEDPPDIDVFLDAEQRLASAPAARHALECGMLDLAARRRGVPVRALLSPEPRDAVPVGTLVVSLDPEAVRGEAERAVSAGFRTLKLKVAAAPFEEDLRRLEAVRAAVPPEIRIRIDANGGWNESEALENLRRLRDVGVEVCEQPLPIGAVEAMRAMRGRVPCAIAADESIGSGADADRLLQPTPAVDVLVLKPMVLGGLWRSMEIARQAQAAGVGSYVSSSLDGLVARGAAAQLAAALPCADWASGLAVGGLFRDEPADHPLAPREGRIRLGGAPGLGFEGGAR